MLGVIAVKFPQTSKKFRTVNSCCEVLKQPGEMQKCFKNSEKIREDTSKHT